jgi:DNA helicase HerA-like ATPase
MKQARAYGVGCVLATQNPMDLDYRALSNAGTWMLGRLQTDADRARVIEGLGEDKLRCPFPSRERRASWATS